MLEMILTEQKLEKYILLEGFYDMLFSIVSPLWIVIFSLANLTWIINMA